MPRITEKPPEVLQAQIASFAADMSEQGGTAPQHDARYLIDNVAHFAITGAQQATRPVGRHESIRDGSGNYINLPEGSQRTIASRADLAEHLRGADDSFGSEGISGRSELLKSYSLFAPHVSKLKTEVEALEAQGIKRFEHPSHLGNGANANAYKIVVGDKPYVVRIPHGDKKRNGLLVDKHMEASIAGRDLPRLEKLTAASYEDSVTVAELMPGVCVRDMTPEDLKHITDKQIIEYIDTIKLANEKGIGIDPKTANHFYDQETGFGIIDHAAPDKGGYRQDIGQLIGWMSSAVISGGFKARDIPKSKETYSEDLAVYKTKVELLERYREAARSRLDEPALEKALPVINDKIEALQAKVENYSDPDWIKEQLAEQKA